MKNTKPYCVTIDPWLKINLGKNCLAGLTGQDRKALLAAVQIVELWCYTDQTHAAATAFGAVVRQMQPKLRFLAFHAIAHVGDWSHRTELWRQADLGDEWPGGAALNGPELQEGGRREH